MEGFLNGRNIFWIKYLWKQLIEKQKQVDNKLSIVYGMNGDVSVLESLNKIAEIINAEIMKRLEEGTMDDDEFDDDF